MKDRYSKSSKLSEAQIRLVVKCFAADLTALQTAAICSVNRDTVNRIFRDLLEAHRDRTAEAASRRIGTLLDPFSPAECANDFQNAGYASE